MPDQIGWTGMKDGKMLDKPEPLYRKETPGGSACPKCGATTVIKLPEQMGDVRFRCGSFTFVNSFQQSFECRIAELVRDLAAAREENDRLLDIILKMYQAVGPIDGGNEIEAAKRCAQQLADRDREISGLRELLKESYSGDEYPTDLYEGSTWSDAKIDAALAQIAARRQKQEPQEGRG